MPRPLASDFPRSGWPAPDERDVDKRFAPVPLFNGVCRPIAKTDMTSDQLFDAAILAARQSPNRVRHVGAALMQPNTTRTVLACNDFPLGVIDTEQRHAGNGRFIWMEHAERNAIYAAARGGLSTEGATLASTFFPCLECARAIVQAGITRLLTLEPDLSDPVWGESFVPSTTILSEGGVQVNYMPRDAAQVHASTMRPID